MVTLLKLFTKLKYLFNFQSLRNSSNDLSLFDEDSDGVVFNQYSDKEIYSATAKPTIAATVVELWNITHVAMHNPKYVKYRVSETYL